MSSPPYLGGICLKVGKGAFFVKLFLVIGLGNNFTPHLHPYPNTCTRYPMADGRNADPRMADALRAVTWHL